MSSPPRTGADGGSPTQVAARAPADSPADASVDTATVAQPVIAVAVAVVRQGEWFLVGRRGAGETLAGHAEFPGGKVRPGESPVTAAVRECAEETGLAVVAFGEYPGRTQRYEHATIGLRFFDCRPLAGGDGDNEKDNANDDGRAAGAGEGSLPTVTAPWHWVQRRRLSLLRFPAGNRELLAMLLAEPAADG